MSSYNIYNNVSIETFDIGVGSRKMGWNIIDPSSFPNIVYCIIKRNEILEAFYNELDIFVKWTVECFEFVLPLVIHMFSLQSCFEWKKYCQIHSTDVLYFSREESPCSVVSIL